MSKLKYFNFSLNKEKQNISIFRVSQWFWKLDNCVRFAVIWSDEWRGFTVRLLTRHTTSQTIKLPQYWTQQMGHFPWGIFVMFHSQFPLTIDQEKTFTAELMFRDNVSVSLLSPLRLVFLMGLVCKSQLGKCPAIHFSCSWNVLVIIDKARWGSQVSVELDYKQWHCTLSLLIYDDSSVLEVCASIGPR